MPTITQPQIQERRPPSVKASISPASLQLLNCLRASPQICQEPLFSSSGPLLFNLRRDSLLQLWIFSRASLLLCHELLSSCLNVSGPLLKSARSLSSAAPDHFCLICQETLFCSSGFSPGHLCQSAISFSPAAYTVSGPSLICQEPLFSSSGPLLLILPRDSLLQL